jgi:hypothetical protein
MGHFSMEKSLNPGSVLGGNQQWGEIADYNSLDVRMKDMGPVWDCMTEKHGLQKHKLDRLASPWHTDLDLGRPMECVNSMNKSRALGFGAFQDTTRSFIDVFDRLRAERIIP